jgi:flavodoxin/ferredoxin
MLKTLIVYFSFGGTTAKVAESIAAGLRSAGQKVELHNIRDGAPKDIEGYDAIGIGTPAYYFRPAFNITEYIRELSDLHGMQAFVFTLYGTYPGATGNDVRKALSSAGAEEIGYFKCRGADFFNGYLREGYLFSPDNPSATELAQAEKFGKTIAGVMSGRMYLPPPEDPEPPIMYRIERLLSSRWIVNRIYSRLFSVKRERCTACNICVQICPTQNITVDAQGRPVWKKNCLLCVCCEMKCPEEAITSPLSWPLFYPAIIYNVLRASKDPSIPQAKVRFSRGETTRL